MRKVIVLFYVSVIFTSLSFAAENDIDGLLNLLLDKAVITTAETAGLRADLAMKKQDDKDKQSEFAVIAGKPLKLSGYNQLRYRNDKSINSFDIRRARLSLKGELNQKIAYLFQADFAGSAAKLLDATVEYKISKFLKLTGGQFKIPFSLENITTDTKLETINLSQVVEALAARSNDIIGNQNGRDVGVQIGGEINKFSFATAIVNGSGINVADTNKQKDLVGRIIISPIKELSLGGSFYQGRYALNSSREGERNRTGLEFTYIVDQFDLKGEYIKGNDGSTRKEGWYLQAGYFFLPKTFQSVAKIDVYNSNVAKANNDVKRYTLGANWYFNPAAFWQFGYERCQGLNAFSSQVTVQF